MTPTQRGVIRLTISLLAVLWAGCVADPLPLAQFRGWSWRDLGGDRFEISVGEGQGDKVREAFLYASSLTLECGYRSFIIMADDGRGASGTYFDWNLGYVANRRGGILVFQPGKYFVIRCEKKRPNDADALFDAEEQLRKRRLKDD